MLLYPKSLSALPIWAYINMLCRHLLQLLGWYSQDAFRFYVWLYHNTVSASLYHILLLFTVDKLTLGQSYDCPIVSVVILGDMGKIDRYLSTTRHNEARPMCIFWLCTVANKVSVSINILDNVSSAGVNVSAKMRAICLLKANRDPVLPSYATILLLSLSLLW